MTPGTNAVRLVKLPWSIGRFSTCSVVTANDRSPLCAWIERRFGRDVHRFASCRRLRASSPGRATRSPPLTPRRLCALSGLEPVHRHFDRVGVRRDVGNDVVARLVRDDRRRLGAACFADEHDRRAGNDATLGVLDRAGDVPVVICAETVAAMAKSRERATASTRVPVPLIIYTSRTGNPEHPERGKSSGRTPSSRARRSTRSP